MNEVIATLIDMFMAWPWLWIGTIFVLGLLVGSFLNVVIHRLPIMLEREWRADAEQFLKEPPLCASGWLHLAQEATAPASPIAKEAVPETDLPLAAEAPTVADTAAATLISNAASDASATIVAGSAPNSLQTLDAPQPAPPRYNLVTPRSCCPKCGAKITALQNIPIVSYVVLGGKCASCSAPISVRYPIVELMTGVLSAAVAWKFGVHWYTAAALYFTWTLIALSWIDFDTTLLPDSMTLPLVWVGILLALIGPVHVLGYPADLYASVIGAALGYVSLRLVADAYKKLRNKEGMAPGDFKLLAAIGAWLGWHGLPHVIVLSSLAGSIIGGLLVLRGRDKEIPIPFGPYLAIAGWVTFMWYEELTRLYWRVSTALLGS